MKSFIAAVSILLLVANVTTAQEPGGQEQPGKKELQRLQGTWRFVSVEENGKALPADMLKERSFFVGGNAFVVKENGKITQVGTLQVHSSKKPMTVNALVTGGEGGEKKDDLMLGIYELVDGTLRMCLDPEGQQRPKEFKAGAGSGLTLWECKSAKPSPKDEIEIVGTYDCETVDPDGRSMVAEAVIERSGDAYQVTFRKDRMLAFVGVGMREGDRFSLSWGNRGQVGISVYRIEKGPKLVGQFTQVGGIGLVGQETLTPSRKFER
jgi:uncharacterized protein (TIGR03067 family)